MLLEEDIPSISEAANEFFLVIRMRLCVFATEVCASRAFGRTVEDESERATMYRDM